MATSAEPRCGRCSTATKTFGTGVRLCPECDFAHCRNKSCNVTIKQLAFSKCPACGWRQ